MNEASARTMNPFNPMTLAGPQPPGLNRYGLTIGLPHSNGLTFTVPWLIIGVAAAGIFLLMQRRK